ncbi:MAG: flagellar export chaperone FliS [Candidatus Omnitrophica bacterium]|nr:flagellar export chaperone FliS [Candidatus Omnitrophota bacterium]
MTNLFNNPQQQYLKTQIETASKPQLLVMIFDAAVKKLYLARQAVEKKQIEKSHTELTKVQRIFAELMMALDFDLGGEMANNLMRIYEFVYHRVVQANMKKDVRLIDEALPIVENLRATWTQAVKKYLNEKDQPASEAGKSAAFAGRISQPAASNLKPAAFATAPAAAGAGQAAEIPPQPRLNLRG